MAAAVLLFLLEKKGARRADLACPRDMRSGLPPGFLRVSYGAAGAALLNRAGSISAEGRRQQ